MFTRPLLSSRAAPLARPVVLASRSPAVLGARAASHSAHDAGPEEHYPEEGFSKPIWRNSALLAIALALLYRVSPSSATMPSLPALEGRHPDENAHPITRYIAHQLTPKAGLWEERQAKHLELAKAQAEDKLLFQEAERPRVRRMRYPGTFNQASPNNIETGSQADLGGLVIKSEKDDFAFGRNSAADAHEDDE